MDPRDYAAEFGSLFESFDEKTMTAQFEVYDGETDTSKEVCVHMEYDVCQTCRGRGKHVNPSIDAHGISGEEFAEDPDFRDEYVRGVYDVSCYECKGRRVVPVPSKSNPPEILAAIISRAEDRAEMIREMAAERRMGA